MKNVLIKFGIIQCQQNALLIIITETIYCSLEGFRFTLGDYNIRLFLKNIVQFNNIDLDFDPQRSTIA